uniref:DUF3591 domain-containing protein n=1 Tax=Panagrellus redivivus TaxID=6233 RepID=A0A7E4UVZ6_PANRE
MDYDSDERNETPLSNGYPNGLPNGFSSNVNGNSRPNGNIESISDDDEPMDVDHVPPAVIDSPASGSDEEYVERVFTPLARWPEDDDEGRGDSLSSAGSSSPAEKDGSPRNGDVAETNGEKPDGDLMEVDGVNGESNGDPDAEKKDENGVEGADSVLVNGEKKDEDKKDEEAKKEESKKQKPEEYRFVPPSLRDDAPLAAIINPELEDIDPRKFYPDFAPGKILRLSRLTAPPTKSSRYAHVYWSSKTFVPWSEEREKQLDRASREFAGKPFKASYAPDPVDVEDDTVHLYGNDGDDEESESDSDQEVPAWRVGPAQIFYDQMNVPLKPKHFDYGLKQYQRQHRRKEATKKNQRAPIKVDLPPVPNIDGCQLVPHKLEAWENEIVWNNNEAQQRFVREYNSHKVPYSGFICTKATRNLGTFNRSWNKTTPVEFLAKPEVADNAAENERNYHFDPSQPIFPFEAMDTDVKWEDDIIWNPVTAENMPEPKMLTLDFEDDPAIFGVPDDIPLDEPDMEDPSKPLERKDHQFTKKSKLILGQVQQRQKQEEQEQMENTMAQIADRDPYNLSQDDFYVAKTTSRQNPVFSGGSMIQHSTPALNIQRIWFPTFMSSTRLRHFHRLPMHKRMLRTLHMDRYGFIDIISLNKFMIKATQEREAKSLSEAGMEVFPIREVSDLSAREGKLVLFEYSEEHPPLLNQPGMASKIRNYFKRANNKDEDITLEYGETAYTHTFPFLGQLEPGQHIQSLENNMFRAPIYMHNPRHEDFVLIKTQHALMLRRCPTLFVVGQECPLQEVPNPNSKKATVFVRDFLLAFIYRLFWASTDTPRRLKMDDIRNAFPHYAESSVRKRLKGCSDFKRLGTGTEQNYWVLRDDFRLPSKEEVLAMITPEMCCANYSMQAAEQRLKDAGYGEKYIFAGDDDNDSDDQVTIEDEIKCAPWNTTRAFLAAQRGKCVLDQTGIADPTGCGAGYSYVRVSAKPQKEDVPQVPKRLVTGTNADLRKLPLREAKEICKKYGVKDEEINSLSRWEIIDVIRTLSTQAAKARSDFSGMARFARGNIRFNYADMQQKYKQHCQAIFEKQNRTLSSVNYDDTDNDSSDEDEHEGMAESIENILGTDSQKSNFGKNRAKGKQSSAVDGDEQEDLRDLMRMIHGDKNETPTPSNPAEASAPPAEASLNSLLNAPPNKDLVIAPNLKITSAEVDALCNKEGPKKMKIIRTFMDNNTRREVIRTEIISNSQVVEAYAKVRTTKDEAFIREYSHRDEEFREEKRKEKRRLQDQLRRIKRNEERQKQGLQPKKSAAPPKPKKESLVKMRCSACQGLGHMKTNKNCPLYGTYKTVGDLVDAHRSETPQNTPRTEVTEIDGTKLRIKRKAIAEDGRPGHGQLKLKFSRDAIKMPKGNKTLGPKPSLPPNFQRALSTADTEFTDDGSGDEKRTPTSSKAPKPGSKRRRSTIEETDYLAGPHKSVHRRRADPKVSMATILEAIYTNLKNVPNIDTFMYPVNSKHFTDYYDVIKEPMDLQQIHKKITSNQYETRKQFFMDMQQILKNSAQYNGNESPYTQTAKLILETAARLVAENEAQLVELEKAINPLLHEDDMVGFSFILEEIIEQCKAIPKSGAFHERVDRRKFPTYYDKVKTPMHFSLMMQKIKEHQYFTVSEFRRDLEQIRINSETFNGPSNPYTLKAVECKNLADRAISIRMNELTQLEANIRKKKLAEGVFIEDDPEWSLDSLRRQLEARAMSPAWDDSQSVADSDRPMTESIVMGDDEDTRMGFEDDSGVLNDDLALSDDEDDEEMPTQRVAGDSSSTSDDEDMPRHDNVAALAMSNMSAAGTLSNDLAMSSSDNEDDDISLAERAPIDDDLDTM